MHIHTPHRVSMTLEQMNDDTCLNVPNTNSGISGSRYRYVSRRLLRLLLLAIADIISVVILAGASAAIAVGKLMQP